MHFGIVSAVVLSILLFSPEALGDAARKAWLCAHVRLMASKHPYSNVIGFADGDLNIRNLTSQQTAAFPDDCRQDNVGVRVVGEFQVNERAVRATADKHCTQQHPICFADMARHPYNAAGGCMHFRIMAFDSGTFQGRGSEDDACFIGKTSGQGLQGMTKESLCRIFCKAIMQMQ